MSRFENVSRSTYLIATGLETHWILPMPCETDLFKAFSPHSTNKYFLSSLLLDFFFTDDIYVERCPMGNFPATIDSKINIHPALSHTQQHIRAKDFSLAHCQRCRLHSRRKFQRQQPRHRRPLLDFHPVHGSMPMELFF